MFRNPLLPGEVSAKIVIFAFVKRLAVILTFFLSLLLGGREVRAAVVTAGSGESAQISQTVWDTHAAPGLMAAGSNAFSGNSTSHGGSIRLPRAGRRVNPSAKTSFRLLKAGKVLDGRGRFLRGISLFRPLPGLFLYNRHLLLMGILRL